MTLISTEQEGKDKIALEVKSENSCCMPYGNSKCAIYHMWPTTRFCVLVLNFHEPSNFVWICLYIVSLLFTVLHTHTHTLKEREIEREREWFPLPAAGFTRELLCIGTYNSFVQSLTPMRCVIITHSETHIYDLFSLCLHCIPILIDADNLFHIVPTLFRRRKSKTEFRIASFLYKTAII